MKIQNTDINLKKLTEAETEKKLQIRKRERTKEHSSDSVKFSEEIQNAEKKVIDILNYPEKRAEKIQEIKKMIKSGSYNVDIHKLTEKIVDDLLFGSFYK